MKKKLISILMSLSIISAGMCVPAFAADTTASEVSSEESASTVVDYPINNTTYIADYSKPSTNSFTNASRVGFRRGDYIVIEVQVPQTAVYKVDVTAASKRAYAFSAAYGEDLETVAASTDFQITGATQQATATSYNENFTATTLTESLTLESGKKYYFKLYLRSITNNDALSVNKLSFTLVSKVMTVVDYPINNTTYIADYSKPSTNSFTNASRVGFRQGNYVVIAVSVPQTAAYRMEITTASRRAYAFSAAYGEDLETVAASTTFQIVGAAQQATATDWNTNFTATKLTESVMLEADKQYYFKIYLRSITNNDALSVNNIRFTDNGGVNLTALEVTGYNFLEAFASDVEQYTIVTDAAPQNNSITINATSEFETVSITNIGEVAISDDVSTIPVTVTSADNTISKTYTIKFVVAKAMTDYTFDFDINKDSVHYTNGYTADDADATATSMILRSGKSFSIYVPSEKALCYNLSAECGTNADGQAISITVNGTTQLDSIALSNTGNYEAINHNLGVVSLKHGLNEIKFDLSAASTDAVSIENFKLALTDTFSSGSFKFHVKSGFVPEYKFTASNSGFSSSGNSATVRGTDGDWVRFDVYSPVDRVVNATVNIASSEDLAAAILVNGKVQTFEKFGYIGSNYSTFHTVPITQSFVIPAGHSTLTYQQRTGALNISDILLTVEEQADIFIKEFSIKNSSEVRAVQTVKKGMEAYASATVKKFGTPSTLAKLILAEYNADGRLVGTSLSTIDVSDMAHYEEKEFKSEYVYKSNGGSIRAFLWDDTFTPLEESIGFVQNNIFPDNITETTVTSQLATETLNSSGEYYSEYGVHNDTYDIDAIFYDGHNGTKTFAYIGIPKGASSTNKVPAMVCVHGGGGKAEISWVKEWNDRGYAAIAMDMRNHGPDQKTHPYKGISPFDYEGAAFLANFENAGMYQSVINVINAHTVIRDTGVVDLSKIGVVGVSWGAITTTTTIGVDDRFSFAIPIYGCGYLDQSATYFRDAYMSAKRSIAWDPANFAAKAEVPVVYVNGDSDPHFGINATTYTYESTPNAYMCIYHNLTHTQQKAQSITQVYDVAENFFNGFGLTPYITVNSAVAENNVFTIDLSIPQGNSISNCTMYYITDSQLPYGGKVNWNSINEYTENNGIVTIEIPEDATYCYASYDDMNGFKGSTKFTKIIK